MAYAWGSIYFWNIRARGSKYMDRGEQKRGDPNLSWQYHWYWSDKPAGRKTGGSWSDSGSQFLASFLKKHRFTPSDLALSFTKTQPGDAELKRRWCSFLIPVTFLKWGVKNSCQSYIGTKTCPSADPVGWATLTTTDWLTTSIKSASLPFLVRLYCYFRSPNHQSGLNLVWPGIIKIVIWSCWPVVNHGGILILSTTVIGMEVCCSLSQRVVNKVVV